MKRLLLASIATMAMVSHNCHGKRIGEAQTQTQQSRQRHLQEDFYFDNVDLNEVSLCGCNSCYDRGHNGYTTREGQESCAQRIMELIGGQQQFSEEAACQSVSEQDEECQKICDPNICDLDSRVRPEKTFCGCQSCTTAAWVAMAGQYSCGARISYVTDFQGMSELDACRKVAGQEFAQACGACNPDTCERVEDYTESLASIHVGDVPTTPPREDIPLTPDFPLYCFPPHNERLRYEGVWGKYTVEVKESEFACGPSDNWFSRNTVHVDNNELTLQFKKNGDRWEASEVRVLLPEEEMPFHYGEYSFSVKSVQIIDSNSGGIVDTVLPVSMILGLFSWDATEDYATHENYNHEVDVEIARWNIDDLADVQFLVQPPGDPHKYRFFSGEGNTYNQAPHKYSFNWKPAQIDWSSTAGGGQTFTCTAEDALKAMQPDYTQCMPADVEIRLNLWHLFGISAPKGMQDSHFVEVVIDDFQYTPSGLTGLPANGICTKNCQCQSLKCQKNRCEAPDVAAPSTPDVAAPSTPDVAAPSIGESFGGEDNFKPQGQAGGGDKPSPHGEAGADSAESIPSSSISDKEISSQEEGGMRKGGKATLTLFFLFLLVLGALIMVRKSRQSSNGDRMATFSDKVILSLPGGDGNPKKKVVVECWETDTDNSDSEKVTSFEMSLKKDGMKEKVGRFLSQDDKVSG